MVKRYLEMWMWLFEAKLKVKTAHFRLPSASRKRKHNSKRACKHARNYNFECDWLIKLSDNKQSNNKPSDNNLASELVKNRSFLNKSQSRKL